MSIEYKPEHWVLVAGRIMVFRPLGASFYIHMRESELAAVEAHIQNPDAVVADDIEDLKPLAVRAYLDAIGFGLPPQAGPQPS